MRHGQGYHAIATNGHDLRDPHLTGEGQRQCREQRQAFKRHEQIELLCASPLRRALQTAAITFSPAISARGLRIIALPMAEECSDAPSDTGSPPELLREEFASELVDFDFVGGSGGEWFRHEGEFAVDPEALIGRAASLRRWIKARPEREVVLVAHGFFNHYLTGDVNEKGEQTTPWWREGELRTFGFVDDVPAYEGGPKVWKGEDVAMIRETEESLQRRGAKESVQSAKSINRPAERAAGVGVHHEDTSN